MVRDVTNGRVAVLGTLDKDKNGKVHLSYTAPEAEKQAEFFQRKDSRMIAECIRSIQETCRNSNQKAPEFYIVPYDAVPAVAGKLRRLQDDPNDPEGLQTRKQYSVYPDNLSKVMYELSEIPFDEMRAMHIDVDMMFKNGTVDKMQRGIFPNEPLEMMRQGSGRTVVIGEYYMRLNRDENQQVQLMLLGPKAQPECQTNKEIRSQATLDERREMEKGKTPCRSYMYNGRRCLLTLDVHTNRIIDVPVSMIPPVEFIGGQRVPDEYREEIRNGDKFEITNGKRWDDPTNSFTGYGHFDVARMDYVVENCVFKYPYIQPHYAKQIEPSRLARIKAGQETIAGRELKGYNGEPLSGRLGIRPDTNAFGWVDNIRQQQTQAAAIAQPSPGEGYSVPDESLGFGIPESVGVRPRR